MTLHYGLTKATPVRGSQTIQWNLDRNGVPFGAIFTAKPSRAIVSAAYTVKLLDGRSAQAEDLAGAKAALFDLIATEFAA